MYTTWYKNGEEWKIELLEGTWVLFDGNDNLRGRVDTIEEAVKQADLLTNTTECDRIQEVKELDAIGQGRCC